MRVAISLERRPRGMAADPDPCGIIERRAAQPPVIEQKATGFDQIDRDPEARDEAQESAGILRDIGLEKGEAQIGKSA